MFVVLSLCFFAFVLYKIFWAGREIERATQEIQSTPVSVASTASSPGTPPPDEDADNWIINPTTGFPMEEGSAIDMAGYLYGEDPDDDPFNHHHRI